MPHRMWKHNLAGVPYDHGDLRQYLASVWHRAKIDPDADHWARRYAGTLGLTVDG